MAIHSTWEDYEATLPWDKSDGKEINLSLAAKRTKYNSTTLRDIACNHVVHGLTLSIPLTKLRDDGEASTHKKRAARPTLVQKSIKWSGALSNTSELRLSAVKG